jgi:hypothetical protein
VRRPLIVSLARPRRPGAQRAHARRPPAPDRRRGGGRRTLSPARPYIRRRQQNPLGAWPQPRTIGVSPGPRRAA